MAQENGVEDSSLGLSAAAGTGGSVSTAVHAGRGPERRLAVSAAPLNMEVDGHSSFIGLLPREHSGLQVLANLGGNAADGLTKIVPRLPFQPRTLSAAGRQIAVKSGRARAKEARRPRAR